MNNIHKRYIFTQLEITDHSLLILFDSLDRCLDLLRQHKWKFSSRTSETSNPVGAWIFAKYLSRWLPGPSKSLNVNVLWLYFSSNFPKFTGQIVEWLLNIKVQKWILRRIKKSTRNCFEQIHLTNRKIDQSGIHITQVWELYIIRAFATKGFTRSSLFNWHSRFLPFTATEHDLRKRVHAMFSHHNIKLLENFWLSLLRKEETRNRS